MDSFRWAMRMAAVRKKMRTHQFGDWLPQWINEGICVHLLRDFCLVDGWGKGLKTQVRVLTAIGVSHSQAL